MAGKKQALEGEIAELYGLPLEGWTAARNALAKRLSGEGRKADAATVQALRKPSLSVSAVNQLFSREEERMGELLAAGKRARAAQGQAVAGRGAAAFREALGAARRQIEDLRRRAVSLLEEGGKGTGGAIAERIGRNLEALAFSPAAAASGERGYLDADLDPPGFEVLSGLRLAPASAPKKQSPDRPSRLLQFKEAPLKEARATAASARREEAEEAEEARRVRALARQRDRIERAAAAVEEAKEKVAALAAEAATAERAAAEARRQADAAERNAAAAKRRTEAAEADLARAEEHLTSERSGGVPGHS
jgi:hypothetical protein